VSDAVQGLLGRLEKVKSGESGWTARCPAHDDDSPSLSVSEGDDGRALVNCHAGCTNEDVVAALGLELSDLFPNDGSPDGRRGWTVADYASYVEVPEDWLRAQFGLRTAREPGKDPSVAIPYVGTSGEMIRTRHRTRDRFWWARDGDGVALYGLDRLADADPSRSVLIVEGESDVHALAFHDVLAVGVPGASSWRSSWTRHLEGRDVHVWMEPDQGGRTLVADVADDLPRAKVIEAPDGYSDPADLHRDDPDRCRRQLGVLAKLATPIRKVASGRSTIPQPRGAEQLSVASAPLSELYNALEGTALEYDLRPYTARGRFTLLSAPPKRGKSTFAALYAHAKATGGTFLGQDMARSTVLYVAPDENWRDVVRRFRSFGTPGDRLHVWRDREHTVARIAARAGELGAGVVVLDTLLRVAGISDENDNAEWDRWFRDAREHVHDSVAVWFAVHHDRKSGGKDGEGIRGASAIFGSVDVAISLQKSDESPHRRILRVEGTRLDHAEPLVVELDEREARYDAVGEQHVVSILEDSALERLREVLAAEPRPVARVHDLLRRRFPESEGDVPQSTVRNRLERLRSAGLATRHGDGGKRDPYRYTLSSSDTPDETTERGREGEAVHGDTRSAGDGSDAPSTTTDEGRSVVSHPKAAEQLSVSEDPEEEDWQTDLGAYLEADE